MLRKKRHIVLSLLLVMAATALFGQAGSASFAFLHLPFSARLNSLGTNNVSIADGELSMALCNPSLLSDETDKKIQLSYAYYMSGLHFGSAMYSHNYKLNRFAVSVHYLDYGKMEYADEYGVRMNTTFGARDILIDLIYARQLGKYFSIGASLKPVYSAYEGYTSFALGADVGAHFQTKDKAFQLGLSLQNIGWQLKKFYEDNDGGLRVMLPMNLQLGFDYHFKHAPLRIGMTIHNMQRWNLGYERSNKSTYVLTSKNGMSNEEWELAQSNGAVMWYDMALRHTIFFLEVVPKNERFYITLSYNHRHRAELALKDQRSLAGFAIGAGLNLKQVRLGFAFSQFTKGQYIYQASLTMDINGFMDKKKTVAGNEEITEKNEEPVNTQPVQEELKNEVRPVQEEVNTEEQPSEEEVQTAQEEIKAEEQPSEQKVTKTEKNEPKQQKKKQKGKSGWTVL